MYAILIRLDRAKPMFLSREHGYTEARRDVEKFLSQHNFIQRDANLYISNEPELARCEAIDIISKMSAALPWLKENVLYVRLFEIVEDANIAIAL